ncbi:MAG TPA: C40 family peptidase [Bacteroidia bacterium]|jgi:cell wall-associated NlpC family hydrolase|nr:C40 family peptidase [Bacteroidia bacterium]
MKKAAIVIIFFFCYAHRAQAQVCDTSQCYIPTVGDSIAEFAENFLGTPYKYGCASPQAGFDCSGLTYYVFNHFHIAVPRSAKDYKTFGKEVSLAECRRGDIIVFRGTHPDDMRAGHVGIIISNPGEPVKFIHASSSDKHSGVVITDYYNSSYPKRFIKVIRVTS